VHAGLDVVEASLPWALAVLAGDRG
jgi:hypothetical protein